jgi:spermidine/putrescine transport system permease protein
VQVNVIGTVMFLAALVCVIVGQVLSNRRQKAV